MSVHTEVTLFCDSCGTEYSSDVSIRAVREQARIDGWVRTRKHGDQCPDCRESAPKGVSE